jgi:hypothetical protein
LGIAEESREMRSIKLPKILTDETVPVRFSMLESKHAELVDYLAFFNETHRSNADLKALMPHLVAAFIAEDRAFARWRAERRSKAPERPTPAREKAAPKPASSS